MVLLVNTNYSLVVACLFLTVFCSVRLAESCEHVTPTTRETLSGSCASIGYSTKCCHYGFGDECKATDGDCYCHSGCFDDENCCSDVHCCTDATTCAEADITSCCVQNNQGLGCMAYNYVGSGHCSCAESCEEEDICCSDAMSVIESCTTMPCTHAGLEPGYCLWSNTSSCVVEDTPPCYCDPFCRYKSLNDCCADVPQYRRLDGNRLWKKIKEMYMPSQNGRNPMVRPVKSQFEEDYTETQVENDYKHYLAQFAAAKAARMQMALSEWSTVPYKDGDRSQVSANEQNDRGLDKSARPLTHTYPYKPRQHTTYSRPLPYSYSDGARPLPHAYADEAHPLPRTYADETRPLPRAYADEARPPPHAYADEARPLPHAYADEARPLPRAYAEEARPLPRAYADETRPLPHAYADEARPLPRAYAEEARPLPRAYADEARPLPRTYADETRPLPRAYADEAHPLPRAYADEARPLPHAYADEARPLPRAYADEARPLPFA